MVRTTAKPGDVYERLTVVELLPPATRGGRTRTSVHCVCGAEKVVDRGNLVGGRIQSCGCLKRELVAKRNRDRGVQVGERYTRLAVLELLPPDEDKQHYRARVRCDCGTEKIVRRGHLRSGFTRSCGCLLSERSSARLVALNRTPEKAARVAEANRIHGHAARRSSEYRAWVAMKSRCYQERNASYDYYGARGIRVCDEWMNSFEAFYDHLGPKPDPRWSLDRINSDDDYRPSNVRWASAKTQASNRRARQKAA